MKQLTLLLSVIISFSANIALVNLVHAEEAQPQPEIIQPDAAAPGDEDQELDKIVSEEENT